MKYIVFKERRSKKLHALIFSDFVTHSSVRVKGMVPVSAGFVDPRMGKPYGESSSLRLKPAIDDEVLLMATLVNSNAHLMMF